MHDVAMGMLALYLRVLRQLGGERRLASALALANVVLAAAQFAEPILFGRVIDALAKPRAAAHPLTFSELMPLVLAWVAFGLLSLAGGVAVSYNADLMSHRGRLAAVARYFSHVLSLPLAFHLGTHSGRVMKVMSSGSDAMWMLWLGFFREHCAALVSLVVLLPLTLLVDARLGLLLCTLVLSFAGLIALVVRRTNELQGKVREYHTNLAEHASDALGNLPVIQSFTRVDAELRTLGDISNKLLEAQTPVLSWWAVAAMATRAAATLTVTAILLLGTWLYLRGEVRLGEVVSFMSLATLLIGRLDGTVAFVSSLFQEAPKLREFFEVLDTQPSVRDRPQARDAGQLSGAIAFERVSFSYDGKRDAVREVSFQARRGETIAFVGATGSGKTTTLSLLYRAFDPSAGAILADGVDLRDYSVDSLRRNIAVVFQEPMLFARSVRENLLMGKPDASDAELVDALNRAQAGELLTQLPQGLDTVLSERGRSLSGGERQRLSIARALLKAPPILILDEATSALDATTEQKLKLALDEVMRGRTTFVIAHRLATIRNATRIAVFDHGQIVELGPFAELVAQDGKFAELARAQFMAEERKEDAAS
ncbi:MAG: cyclic beta,2-glucan transporter [Myxococcaceae bacterium]|nr:cyclic beta,2-glucan transporter [Myxococcaceae bacterium]